VQTFQIIVYLLTSSLSITVIAPLVSSSPIIVTIKHCFMINCAHGHHASCIVSLRSTLVPRLSIIFNIRENFLKSPPNTKFLEKFTTLCKSLICYAKQSRKLKRKCNILTQIATIQHARIV